MLCQSLYGYRCVICTFCAPMCCYEVCVQGVHSTRHLKHLIQELAIRITTLTLLPLALLLSRESSIKPHAYTFGSKMKHLVNRVLSAMHDALQA